MPSTTEGTVSPSPSGRNAAMPSSCIQGIASTCRPAFPSPPGGGPLSQGPSASRRAAVVRGAEREPAGVVARSQDEEVALAERDALGLHARLELAAGHRLARL